MMTTHPGIFAGGDMVEGDRTVTTSVGHGKKATKYIDTWSRQIKVEPKVEKEAVKFEELNTWYYTDAPHAVRERLAATRRVYDFSEVVQGHDESTALEEAPRCISCGNCFECDNCLGVCPDNAIKKLGPGFEIDVDDCKGCGVCVTECLANAIEMVSDL